MLLASLAAIKDRFTKLTPKLVLTLKVLETKMTPEESVGFIYNRDIRGGGEHKMANLIHSYLLITLVRFI